MNRRLFFTTTAKTLAAAGAVLSGIIPATKVFATEALDKGIKKFKYVHELPEKLKGAMKSHLKKLIKKAEKFKAEGVQVQTDSLKPVCQYCKFWEEPENGYGYCRYVAKKGNTKGQKAYMKAWCSMFNPVSKASDFKKRLSLKA